MKKWLILLVISLAPLSANAQECTSDADCDEGMACIENACPPCAEGEECPPCTATCEKVGVLEEIGGPPSCETDADCPSGLSCQEMETYCGGMMTEPGCVCPECAEGDECPPCDCGDEPAGEPLPSEEDPDCVDGMKTVLTCMPVPCDETTVCGENFACQPMIEICSGGGASGGSMGSAGSGETTAEPAPDETGDSAGSTSDETTVDEQDAGSTEEEPAGDAEVVVEEEEWVEDCEVIESACLPVEIPCATDDECPADWECEIYAVGVSVGGTDCACPDCPPGEDCPPCDCPDEEVVEEVEFSEGMCMPAGWAEFAGGPLGGGGYDESAQSGPGGNTGGTGESAEVETGEPATEEGQGGDGDNEESLGAEEGGEEEEGTEEGGDDADATESGEDTDAAAGESVDAGGEAETAVAASSDEGCSTRGASTPALWMFGLLMGLATLRRRESL